MAIEIFIPITGHFLEQLVTRLYCSKYGVEDEVNPLWRGFMRKTGIWKSFLIGQAAAIGVVIPLGYLGCGLADESYMVLDTISVRPQEIYAYGLGILTYAVALSNLITYTRRRMSDRADPNNISADD